MCLEEQTAPVWPHPFPSSGLSFFPFMLPLHSGEDIFVSLHHAALSQIISFSLVSTAATSNHFTFYSLQSWLDSGRFFSYPCLPVKKKNDGGGEERERMQLE